MDTSNKVVLLGGSRTPIGAFGRSLSRIKVDKLAEHAMKHAMRRAGIQPGQVDGLILGHGFQSAYTPNTARFAWINAGWPASVPAYTLQIQCGSGMKAVNEAMDKIKLGHGNVFVAGGAESMSTVPYLVDGSLRFDGGRSKPFTTYATQFDKSFMAKVIDFISRRFANGMVSGSFNRFFAKSKFGSRPYIGVVDDALMPSTLLWDMTATHMPGTAQRVADTYEITRAEADAYALRSQERAAAAIKSGRFALEIDPVDTGRGVFAVDEHPRATSAAKLAKLKGVNRTRDITAGNSSGINDAACALVLSSSEWASQQGIKPLAELLDHCVAGVEPETMGLGPVAAITQLLKRNNYLTLDATKGGVPVDLIEINEAFAAQYLGCEKLLGLDREKVNVNGGAIALGHPIAMSGARLILSLAHELKLQNKEYGIAALCIGGGMGIATLIRNPDASKTSWM